MLLASRSSLRWFVIAGAIGAGLFALATHEQTPRTQPVKPRASTPVRAPVPVSAPVTVTVTEPDCVAWERLDVPAPTRLCTEDETATMWAAYESLGIGAGTRPLEAAARIIRLPVACRADLPKISTTFDRASLSAMGMKDFPRAEQFSELAILYGSPFAISATNQEIRKALKRERKAVCRQRERDRQYAR